MPHSARVIARRDQIGRGLTSFRDRLKRWLIKRRAADTNHQYHGQLKALELTFEGGFEVVHSTLEYAALSDDDRVAYAKLRRFEATAFWLQRTLSFFQAKFDQRDDPEYGPILRSADEIVWSCHQPAIRRARQLNPEALGAVATPLAFIDAQLSPWAYPQPLLPAQLKGEGYDVSLLERLPIPLVRLPPTAAHSPWLLVLLGHEVAHHLHFGLLRDMTLVGRFRAQLGASLEAAGGGAIDPNRIQKWRRWSEEIFADLASVALLGTPAIDAIAEIERGVTRKRAVKYPPSQLRLALMQRMAKGLGIPVASPLPLSSQQDIECRAVLGAFAQPVSEFGFAMRDLLPFEQDLWHTDTAIKALSAGLLVEGENPNLAPGLTAPRHLCAAAWMAHDSLVGRDQTARAASVNRLATNFQMGLQRCREPGTRAGPETARVDPNHGANRALQLLGDDDWQRHIDEEGRLWGFDATST